jgi:hypothetical protein
MKRLCSGAMTLSINGIYVTLSIAMLCYNAECHETECGVLLIIMLNVIMLSVILLSDVAPLY